MPMLRSVLIKLCYNAFFMQHRSLKRVELLEASGPPALRVTPALKMASTVFVSLDSSKP